MFIVCENIKYLVMSYELCDLIVYHTTTITSNAMPAG